jgi:CheY-like chemotaxis protein
VEVLLERINSHIEITVTDTGEGIKPEFLPHVFDRFRQADSSTTREHPGLGLGLSIVRQLVELHGGRVAAKSAGKGQGATFSVMLPLAVARLGDEPREHPTRSLGPPLDIRPISLGGITVLVVDDEPDTRNLIRRLLDERGARVITAGAASEGLELIRLHRPDLILSDIGMPHVDGYSFLRQVRSLPPDQGGKIPAVALTAFARSEDRTRAMMAGYQLHIAKPIEPPELIAMVASAVGRIDDGPFGSEND